LNKKENFNIKVPTPPIKRVFRASASAEHWPKLKGMILYENIYNKRDLRMVVSVQKTDQ
jgi:hypothetical protein